MDTTLYGVLGVAQSADAGEIRRAYRKQVKDYHPDVSDAPDARRQFKRVQTAKGVLTDEDERARYDRLGHETYARRYLDADTWGVSETPAASSNISTEAASAGASSTSDDPGQSTVTASHSTANSAGRRQYRADGGTGAAYYRPGERIGVEPGGIVDRVSGALLEVGSVLVAHLLLLLSTAALAAWLVLGSSGTPTLTSVVVATAMVGITGCLSLLHVTSTLCR